jgi:hypothetical protein
VFVYVYVYVYENLKAKGNAKVNLIVNESPEIRRARPATDAMAG